MIIKIKNWLQKDAGLNELVSSGAISFFMQGAGMLSGYILMALIANYYGARILGIYSFSYTTLTLAVAISALGMDMVILKIAGKRGNSSALAVLKKIYKIVIPIALMLSFILIPISFFYSKDFFDEMEYKKYLIITSASLLFSVILAVNIEYLRGEGRISVSEFLRNVFRPFVSILLIVMIYVIRYDVYAPIYAVLISALLACLLSIYCIFAGNHKNNNMYSQTECNETLHSLMSSGVPILVSMLSFTLISNMVIFFIKGYENSVMVGLVLVSIKLAGLVNMPLMVLNKVCAPRIAKLYWENEHIELQKYLTQVTGLAFYAAVILGLILIVFSKYALSIFGSDFVQAKSILYILILGQLASCACGSVGIFMMMTGNEKAYQNIALLVVVLSFVFYVAVLPLYGVLGAACVLAFSQAALNIMSVVYIKFRLGFVTMYLPFGSRYFFK